MIKRLSRKYFGHVNKPSTAASASHWHDVGFPNYVLTYLQHNNNVGFASMKLKPQKSKSGIQANVLIVNKSDRLKVGVTNKVAKVQSKLTQWLLTLNVVGKFPQHVRSMHDWCGIATGIVCSKDVLKQLAWTSLRWFTIHSFLSYHCWPFYASSVHQNVSRLQPVFLFSCFTPHTIKKEKTKKRNSHW